MNIEQEPTTFQTDDTPQIYTLEDINLRIENDKSIIREKIIEAISSSPNKEPFDYAKFAELYWRKDPQGDLTGAESESVVDSYVEKYYLDFPQISTIEEFAQNLEKLDSQAGN